MQKNGNGDRVGRNYTVECKGNVDSVFETVRQGFRMRDVGVARRHDLTGPRTAPSAGPVAPFAARDPAVALSIYADVKADELRAVGASLFG